MKYSLFITRVRSSLFRSIDWKIFSSLNLNNPYDYEEHELESNKINLNQNTIYFYESHIIPYFQTQLQFRLFNWKIFPTLSLCSFAANTNCGISCYNTGGDCQIYNNQYYYCSCYGSTYQYGTTGCQCQGTNSCDSNGCFQGCTGTQSDGSRYYGSPPMRPYQCLEYTAPRICSGWAVTGCQSGYSLYNNEFCCGTNCAQCNATACLWCQSPLSQYIDGIQCKPCSSPQICGQTYCAVSGCTGAYYLNGSNCVNCNNNCLNCNSSTCFACSSSTSYYLSGANCISCNSPYTCTGFKISGCVDGYYMPQVGTCNLCPASLTNCGACSNASTCTSCSPTSSYYLYQLQCQICDQNRVCTNSIISSCSDPVTMYLDTSISPTQCQPCTTPRICSNSTVTGCQLTYYQQGNNCYSCQNYCNSCTSVSVCTQCYSKYYIFFTRIIICATCTANYSTVACQTCVSPCLTCNWSYCLTCIVGKYYLATNNVECLPCPSWCSTCTYNTCTCESPCSVCTFNACNQCISNQFTIDGKTCQSCSANCTTCVNATTCTQCESAYYLSGTICTACPAHCPTCNATSCFTCLDQCSNCDHTGCLKCLNAGYYIDSFIGNCKRCSDAISGCTYCTNASVCTGCASQNQYQDGATCKICPSHCLTCDLTQCYTCAGNCVKCNRTSCLTCPNESYYNSGLDCKACGSSCKTCNSTHCITCVAQNQYPTGDHCNLCPSHCSGCTSTVCTCLSNCATCDMTKCLTCVASNYISGTQCAQCPIQCSTCTDTTCTTCIAECLTCDYTKCLTCTHSNYYVADIICIPCHSTCSVCTSLECTGCVDPHYYPIASQCKSSHSTCKTCDKTKCLTCYNANEYLSGDQCVTCPSHCSQCDGQICSSCVSPCADCNMSSCLRCVAQNYYIIGPQCIQCHSTCATCDQSKCLTCTLLNYYINTNICSICPTHCATCNSNTCLTCNGLCGICNYTSCISCKATNQYISGLDCIQSPTVGCAFCNIFGVCQICTSPLTLINNTCIFICDPLCKICTQEKCLECHFEDQYISGSVCIPCMKNCKTCSDSFTCLTCDETRVLESGSCVCPERYTETNGRCTPIDCKLLSSRTLKFCNYVDCADGVWEYGEKCDNGNQLGCLDCSVQERYICKSTILQPSICIKLQQHCINGTMMSNTQVNCDSCEQGYYLLSNQCMGCQKQCLTCDTPSKCVKCRFPSVSETQCLLCESNAGYYSDYVSNTCFTICGDNIIAGDEECDIGIESIGCTKCQVNSGYACQESTCSIIIYPLPTIVVNESSKGIYDNQRIFLISYNTLITTQNISIKLSLNDSNIHFNQQIAQNDDQFVINITLMNQSLSQTLLVKFDTPSNIMSILGYSQQIDYIVITVPDYILLSQDSLNKVQDSVQGLTYILIFLINFIGLSILLGGLETFWNLLDLVQVVSYMQYINVKVYPYNLSQFLNLFTFIQLPNNPVMKLFNVKYIISAYLDINDFYSLPDPIANDGFTSVTIFNIIPLAQVWFVPFLFVLLSKCILTKIKKIKITVSTAEMAQGPQTIRSKLNKFIIKLFVQNMCSNISRQWLWSGVMRTFQSSAYDIAFAIVIGFYGFTIATNKTSLKVNSYLTLTLLLAYIYATVKMFIAAVYNEETLQSHKLSLGSVFEGLHIGGFCTYYNSLLLIKKFLFMISLVLCFNQPVFQILNIMMLSSLQILILIAFKPLKNKLEQYKQLSCEILLLTTEILLAVLILDDNLVTLDYDLRYLIGWFGIFSLLALIITQVVFDIAQQIEILKHFGRQVKKLYFRITGQVSEVGLTKEQSEKHSKV